MTKRSNRKRSKRRAAAAKQKEVLEQTTTTGSRQPEPVGDEGPGNDNPRSWWWIGIVVALVGLVLVWLFFAPESPLKRQDETMSWDAPPAMTIDTSKDYYASIQTEKGDIRIDLHEERAPRTVNNFVFLARQGFYDDTIFHRVIPGFMAQAGDPTGTGTGGPGYTFDDEFHPELSHDSAGVASMANRGPNTNGSQFFITYAPQPHLDGQHAVFGQVVEGMDVLESLEARDPENLGAPATTIQTIEIQEQ
jgi:cyclophilin family peptidyl-prolyl cis-trans isomerase